MIENAHKHIEHDGGKKPHWDLIAGRRQGGGTGPFVLFRCSSSLSAFYRFSCWKLRKAGFLSPLAFTKTYAMVGSSLLSVTIVPVLMGYMIRGKIRPEGRRIR